MIILKMILLKKTLIRKLNNMKKNDFTKKTLIRKLNKMIIQKKNDIQDQKPEHTVNLFSLHTLKLVLLLYEENKV